MNFLTKTRRSKYLINPNFQFKVIMYLLLLTIIAFSSVYIVYSHYYSTLVDEGVKLGLNNQHAYFKLIGKQRDLLFNFMIYLFIFLATLIFVSGIYFSHRIAGPLHRLQLYFKKREMQEGKELKFRKNDYFQEIPEVINDYFNEKKSDS